MKKKRLNAGQMVREIARKRVGTVPGARTIVPKVHRALKHKKRMMEEE